MSTFARFGLKNFSPSQLNLARTQLGIWAVKYIAKVKDPGGPSAWRGTAVEEGFAALLNERPMDVAHGIALNVYREEIVKGGRYGAVLDQEEVQAEAALIEPMLQQLSSFRELSGWGPVTKEDRQVVVEYDLHPRISIPMIGKLDFAFPAVDVDLKTTARMPDGGVPRPDNRRQVSFYRKARGKRGALLYTTKAKTLYCEVTDQQVEEDMAYYVETALSLGHFLSRCQTREDVMRSVQIDWDYRFAPPKMSLDELLACCKRQSIVDESNQGEVT